MWVMRRDHLRNTGLVGILLKDGHWDSNPKTFWLGVNPITMASQSVFHKVCGVRNTE